MKKTEVGNVFNQHLEPVRQEWLQRALSADAPLQRPAVEAAMSWLYGLAGKAAPQVCVVGSPPGAQLAANLLVACFELPSERPRPREFARAALDRASEGSDRGFVHG